VKRNTIKIYARLKRPFCKIKIPKIIKTKLGRPIRIIRKRLKPQIKSTQLPKSCNIPKVDFANRSIPKKVKIDESIPKPIENKKIAPAIRSIAPKIFINIFFKPRFSLKIYAQVAQPG
jgi:hypothetical protein